MKYKFCSIYKNVTKYDVTFVTIGGRGSNSTLSRTSFVVFIKMQLNMTLHLLQWRREVLTPPSHAL